MVFSVLISSVEDSTDESMEDEDESSVYNVKSPSGTE